MNRIILIGNGFDLAHGLKTSYADFIHWYWKEWGKRLLYSNSKTEEDAFCVFKLKSTVPEPDWRTAFAYFFQNEKRPGEAFNEIEAVEFARRNTSSCTFVEKSVFFKEICKQLEDKHWVDIENVYYSYLSAGVIDPKVINDDLDYLRKKLIEYLLEVQKDITEDILKEGIKEKINAPFKGSDIAVSAMLPDMKIQFLRNEYTNSQLLPEKTLLLTFNYTNTTDLYKKLVNNCIVNHIHGKLDDLDSVIFGYGDELDEHYKAIENKNDNEYLRNIKSIKYLEANNYRSLLNFIESAPYQIFIMGHSCGNSDRTLLNTLFEHKNCISIKPFYYINDEGKDNYIDLVQNISRNFTDKKMMRDKVVDKTLCKIL